MGARNSLKGIRRRHACDRSVRLFDDLQSHVSRCRYHRAELKTVWRDRRMISLHVNPSVSDINVSAGHAASLDPFRAHQLLRGPFEALLSELCIPFGSLTVDVREGTVDELVIELRVRRGEKIPAFAAAT